MMKSNHNAIFEQLRTLQLRLQATVNRLWSIKLALTSAYRYGHQEYDFLPRRLSFLKKEEQLKFDQLLRQLNFLVSTKLDSALIALDNSHDMLAMVKIRKTIRYIQNAFVGDLSLRQSLTQINTLLPPMGGFSGRHFTTCPTRIVAGTPQTKALAALP